MCRLVIALCRLKPLTPSLSPASLRYCIRKMSSPAEVRASLRRDVFINGAFEKTEATFDVCSGGQPAFTLRQAFVLIQSSFTKPQFFASSFIEQFYGYRRILFPSRRCTLRFRLILCIRTVTHLAHLSCCTICGCRSFASFA
jgi:hypothetical protein